MKRFLAILLAAVMTFGCLSALAEETPDTWIADRTIVVQNYVDDIGYALPDDLDKVNREFFLYASEQGVAYEKITCGGTYHAIRDEMTDQVNDAAWSRSKKYQRLNGYEKKVLMGFINNAVLNAYREWVQDGKKIPMDEVIEITNKLVLGGVRGFFK